jgi:hypothetical protein
MRRLKAQVDGEWGAAVSGEDSVGELEEGV